MAQSFSCQIRSPASGSCLGTWRRGEGDYDDDVDKRDYDVDGKDEGVLAEGDVECV